MKTVIAFDVSKGSSILASYDEQENFIFEEKIMHSRSGFRILEKKINFLNEKYDQIPEIVLESTGVYSRAIERFLHDHGYSFYLLNPLEANFQTQSLRRHKTDKSDAHELAKSHFKVNRSQAFQQEDYYDIMRTLARRYDEIANEKRFYKNKIHALLQLSFPEIERVFKTKSTLFYNVIKIFSHPETVLNQSKTIVRKKIKQSTKKNYSLKNLEKRSIQLIDAARDSYPAIDANDYQCELIQQYAMRVLQLDQEKKSIIEEMATLSEGRKEYEVLLSFPGIQKNTACRLIGEIGDISRFKNNKQVNAYVGIDVVRYQSGTIQHKDKINRRGNKRLRSILFFMVVSMLGSKKPNHIVDYYYKMKQQPYNKHHKVAVIACINKFIRVIFHLIQHAKLYDYNIASNTA